MSLNPTSPNDTTVPPPSPNTTTHRRRSSFAELFASRPGLDTGSTSRTAMADAQAQAAAETRTRRLSITTLGLSGSPSHTQQTSPFGTLKRGKSMSTASAVEEDSAIDEADGGDAVPPMSPSRSPPMARRVSFGARAYGNARTGSVSQAAGIPMEGGSTNGNAGADTAAALNGAKGSPPGMRKSGEGFNWTENFRSRAQRASVSAASGPGGLMGVAGVPATQTHKRSTSQQMPEPAPAKPPAKVKTPPKQPDHFQERILKGDFYMD